MKVVHPLFLILILKQLLPAWHLCFHSPSFCTTQHCRFDPNGILLRILRRTWDPEGLTSLQISSRTRCHGFIPSTAMWTIV